LSYHYEFAMNLLNRFYDTMDYVVGDDSNNDDDQVREEDSESPTIDYVLNSTLVKDFYENVLLSAKSIWDFRTLNAIPPSFEDAKIALQKQEINVIFQPNATRSIEWLQREGKCADHIYWDYSTLKGAGRGGFARRDLPSGTVITGTPLRHLPRRFFNMFDLDDDDDDDDDVVGHQLALNYCFGHPESSLLLLPYGPGINHINHNRSLANMRVQWAEGGGPKLNAGWLLRSPTALEFEESTGLALDYVATRDISEGEELFLDYGIEWEVAWEAHKYDWTRRQAECATTSSANTNDFCTGYTSARSWNKVVENTSLRTLKEEEENPYPGNLQIRCHTDLVDEPMSEWSSGNMVWEWDVQQYGFPCEILYRYPATDTTNESYLVNVRTETTDRWEGRRTITKRYHYVPQDAIRFFDKPHTTDMHIPFAFRHPIGFPDELLPDAWRDLRQSVHDLDESNDDDSDDNDDTDFGHNDEL
jgi:hypothetical protein